MGQAGQIGRRSAILTARPWRAREPIAHIARIIIIAPSRTTAPRPAGRSARRSTSSSASLSLESGGPGVGELADAYLAELEHAGRSPHTLRAYRTELGRLQAFHPGPVDELDTDTVRRFLATRAKLSAASRARTHAALASFLSWAYRHEHIAADPIARLERVRVNPPAPRGLAPGQVEQILAAIPATSTATACCSA